MDTETELKPTCLLHANAANTCMRCSEEGEVSLVSCFFLHTNLCRLVPQGKSDQLETMQSNLKLAGWYKYEDMRKSTTCL